MFSKLSLMVHSKAIEEKKKQTQDAVKRKVVFQDDVFHQMQEDFLISFVQKVNR